MDHIWEKLDFPKGFPPKIRWQNRWKCSRCGSEVDRDRVLGKPEADRKFIGAELSSIEPMSCDELITCRVMDS